MGKPMKLEESSGEVSGEIQEIPSSVKMIAVEVNIWRE